MRRNKGFYSFLFMFISTLCLLLTACTSVKQDERTYWDLIQHFKKNGVKITTVNPLMTEDVKADKAFAFTIGERQIGVYSYDQTTKNGETHLKRVDETGVFYVRGIKFQAKRNGSFILIDYAKHPDSARIVKAFESF